MLPGLCIVQSKSRVQTDGDPNTTTVFGNEANARFISRMRLNRCHLAFIVFQNGNDFDFISVAAPELLGLRDVGSAADCIVRRAKVDDVHVAEIPNAIDLSDHRQTSVCKSSNQRVLAGVETDD